MRVSISLARFPCKDCEKRELGCHSNCTEYKQAKNENERLNKKKREEAHLYEYSKAYKGI